MQVASVIMHVEDVRPFFHIPEVLPSQIQRSIPAARSCLPLQLKRFEQTQKAPFFHDFRIQNSNNNTAGLESQWQPQWADFE